MPTILTSTGISFSDGTSQNTAASGGDMSTSAVRTNHDTNVSFTTGDTGKALIMLSSTTRANYAQMNYNYNLRLYVNNVEVASQNLASVLELSSRYSGTGLTVYYLYSGSPNTSFNVKGNWSFTGGSEGYVQIATVSY